jgi:hypothetical protein
MPRKPTELSGVLNSVDLGSYILTDTEPINSHSKKKKKETKKKVPKKTVSKQNTDSVSNNNKTLNKITNSVSIVDDSVKDVEDACKLGEELLEVDANPLENDSQTLEYDANSLKVDNAEQKQIDTESVSIDNTEPLEHVDGLLETEQNDNKPGDGEKPKSGKTIIHPSVHWMFTYNNPPEDFVQLLSLLPDVKRFVIQKEKGELRGTEHLQGYVEFLERTRPKTIVNWTSKIHWTKAKCVPEAIAYCQKKETRIAGPWYKGIIPNRPLCILTEGMLFPWQKQVIDIIGREPDDRKIFWFWEPEGNSGKTTFCKYLAIHYGACILGGKSADMKNAIATMAKYPQIIVIDVPRSSFDYISYQGIEEIKNGMFFSGKYESKMVIGPVPHLIVFANETPDTTKLSADRWQVIRI